MNRFSKKGRADDLLNEYSEANIERVLKLVLKAKEKNLFLSFFFLWLSFYSMFFYKTDYADNDLYHYWKMCVDSKTMVWWSFATTYLDIFYNYRLHLQT